jgi:hypothetical protein
MLHLEKNIKDESYTISIKSSGIIVGKFEMVDGFYYFTENKNRSWGYWSEEFLKSLSTELESLNKKLNMEIEHYFNYK